MQPHIRRGKDEAARSSGGGDRLRGVGSDAEKIHDNQDADSFAFEADVDHGLLTRRRKSMRSILRERANPYDTRLDWLRPVWLGLSLFMILFAFWLLDSLKDPVFATLVKGNLDSHQPPAKICSVVTTLCLVCLFEFAANARQQQQQQKRETERSREDIMNGGGRWSRMDMFTASENKDYRIRCHKDGKALGDRVSVEIFGFVGIPYFLIFLAIAGMIQQYEDTLVLNSPLRTRDPGGGFDAWFILGYMLYASIESFGSIAVAAFWSYTNSTLSLDDAERFYGPIVAVAQLGAIGGSTMVAADHWSPPTLIISASLIILLQILLMKAYDRRFKPTSVLASAVSEDDDASIRTWIDENVTMTKPFWSGVYLILKHNYAILILGVSCLYEVSLTCLDYQMKLLGWARFEETDLENMSFSEFMGRFGQAVNIISLVLSSMVFPFLIRKVGLRLTLRLFPTLLLIATIVAYGALPGNLTVLFMAMALLKAMTYSVHDPSKEILYLPTSNGVKLRAKFWIDVVGARISKAVGSGINSYAGSVDRSVRVGTVPSILTAAALWLFCYYAGIEFDRLLESGEIIGIDETKELEAESYMNIDTDGEQELIEFYEDSSTNEHQVTKDSEQHAETLVI